MGGPVIATDQGTTSTKAYVLDPDGGFRERMHIPHRQIYPRPGWVEHDPQELFDNVLACMQVSPDAVAAGLANQGETVIAWDARDGRPVCNAIVWQDNRTAEVIEQLRAKGAEEITRARAGLPLDTYFSASKLRWILDHVPEARALERAGHLRMGTSDAYFLDRLSGEFVTDVSTAARTSLMNLRDLTWDPVLCDLFGVPGTCLPVIRQTAGPFGAIRGGLPICASVVDQSAALFGHQTIDPGSTKITFGTGAFALCIINDLPMNGDLGSLLTTVAWKLGDAPAVYALDGGVYCAAAAVDWARREGLFKEFDEISAFSGPSAISRGIVCVPAFAGLGAPHWDNTATGTFQGIGLDTTRMDLCQAVLEGVVLRSAEVVRAMQSVAGEHWKLSIDGGLSRNAYLRQFLADATDCEVSVPATGNVTALGTAWLAMIGAGMAQIDSVFPGTGEASSLHVPQNQLSEVDHLRFAAAVARSAGWRSF